jgi:hypothetical protein
MSSAQSKYDLEMSSRVLLDALKEKEESEEKPILEECFGVNGNVEESIIWCNGRCEGLANTAACTCLCLQLWQEKVKVLRHQVAVKEIIEKHHHNPIVLTPVKLGNGEILSIRPLSKPRKHDRETDAQVT